jgi:hypothetical protein
MQRKRKGGLLLLCGPWRSLRLCVYGSASARLSRIARQGIAAILRAILEGLKKAEARRPPSRGAGASRVCGSVAWWPFGFECGLATGQVPRIVLPSAPLLTEVVRPSAILIPWLPPLATSHSSSSNTHLSSENYFQLGQPLSYPL